MKPFLLEDEAAAVYVAQVPVVYHVPELMMQPSCALVSARMTFR